MQAAWHRVQTAAGPVDVWLPSGETLDDVHGIAYWSPDPRLGRFTIVSDEDGDGDALLATERAHGEVAVESDERSQRGGASVRRIRYRVRRDEPRDVIRSGDERRHAGGERAEHLADVLLIGAGDQTVRAGYSVRADAPAELRERFAEVLDRVRIGSEA
jgi:hypothetical protein